MGSMGSSLKHADDDIFLCWWDNEVRSVYLPRNTQQKAWLEIYPVFGTNKNEKYRCEYPCTEYGKKLLRREKVKEKSLVKINVADLTCLRLRVPPLLFNVLDPISSSFTALCSCTFLLDAVNKRSATESLVIPGQLYREYPLAQLVHHCQQNLGVLGFDLNVRGSHLCTFPFSAFPFCPSDGI